MSKATQIWFVVLRAKADKLYGRPVGKKSHWHCIYELWIWSTLNSFWQLFYSVVLMLSFHSHVPIFANQVQIKTDFYLWALPSVWDHSFRTFSKFSEKLTFLTYVRVSSGRKCQFFKNFANVLIESSLS